MAGVALLDASSPRQLEVLPGWRATYEQSVREHPALLRRERLRVWSGWERLMGGCTITDDDEAEEQERSKTLSPHSWRVVARGAGHAVHHDRLALVVGELRLLIEDVRGAAAPPFGTTVVK